MAFTPSKIEDQHVLQEELRLRMLKLEKEQRETAEAEKRRLKELHWMHCPKCGQKLATEKYGTVEIDICPSCKGVWLDANELGTIVANASTSGIFRSWLGILRGPEKRPKT